jgi:hypothetical protein
MVTTWLCASALVLLMAGGALAQQPTAPPTAPPAAAPALRGMAACRAEFQTICRGLEAGGSRRLTCLEQNRRHLSPACAASVQQRLDQRAERQLLQPAPPAARQAETQAPPPVPVAPATPPATPPAPSSGAPPPATADARGATPLRDCRPDMQSLCATVQPGGGARIACLRQNTDRLSPRCAQALAAFDLQQQDRRRDGRAANRLACWADAQRLCRGLRGPDRQACLAQNQAQLSPACVEQVARRVARAARGQTLAPASTPPTPATPPAPAASKPKP